VTLLKRLIFLALTDADALILPIKAKGGDKKTKNHIQPLAVKQNIAQGRGTTIMSANNSKVKRYKASVDLKQRIGSGPLDTAAVERAQHSIENNKIDFSPMGLEFLKTLEHALNEIEKNPNGYSTEEQIKTLIAPVMQFFIMLWWVTSPILCSIF